MMKFSLVGLIFATIIAVIFAVEVQKVGSANIQEKLQEVKSLSDILPSQGPKACNVVTCDSQCRGIGWLGGFCYNGECWCFR